MRVFVAHSVRDRDLVALLARALHEHGHETVAPFAAEFGSDVLSDVSASIRSADAMVAVLTSVTPSVFYELGLAAGASIPTLVAARSGSTVPMDIITVPFVQLSDDPTRDVQAIVRRIGELRSLTETASPVFQSAGSALAAAVEHPDILESMSPADFENAVMECFKAQGYSVSVSASARDTGIDFVLTSPTDKRTILVEVKKQSAHGRVSVDTVRRLETAVSVLGASLGVVVASSGFTAAAAAMANAGPIVLRTFKELVASRSANEFLASPSMVSNER